MLRQLFYEDVRHLYAAETVGDLLRVLKMLAAEGSALAIEELPLEIGVSGGAESLVHLFRTFPDTACNIVLEAPETIHTHIGVEDVWKCLKQTDKRLPRAPAAPDDLDIGIDQKDILLESGLWDQVQQFLAVLLPLEVFLPQLLDVLIGIDLHPVLQEYGVEVLAFIFCLHNRKFRNKIAIKLLIRLVLLHKSCYFCCRMKESPSYYRVCCPNCGKYMKVRILELEGVLRLSLHCPSCKQQSTIELKDIKAQE